MTGFIGGIEIAGKRLLNLRYADCNILLSNTVEELQELVNRINMAGQKYGFMINADKTKTMAGEDCQRNSYVTRTQIEQVYKFPYLGSTITDDKKCT